jgi:hypothetical protein
MLGRVLQQDRRALDVQPFHPQPPYPSRRYQSVQRRSPVHLIPLLIIGTTVGATMALLFTKMASLISD